MAKLNLRVATIGGALICATTVVTAPVSTADPSSPPTPLNKMSAAEVQHEKALREKFGLPASDAAVANAHTEASSAKELGIPLTGAEAQEMAFRDQIAIRAGQLDSSMSRSSASSYAGLWIDQRAGGLVHVQFTARGPQARRLAAVDKELPGMPYVIDHVKFSQQTLTKVQSELSDRMVKEAKSKLFQDASLDTKANRIRVRVSDRATSAQMAALREQFPQATVERTSYSWSSESRDRSSGALYGGEWISSNFGIQCTAGYSRATTGTTNVTITAGHCGAGPWFQGKTGSTSLGSTQKTGFSVGGSGPCDCQAIGQIPANRVTSSVLIANSGTPYYYSQTATSYPTGTKLCFSGAQYGDAHGGGIGCGEITSSKSTVTYSDRVSFTLTDAVLTDITGSASGDSGAPYGSGRVFMGIHGAGFGQKGKPAISTAFSKSSRLSGLGITVRY